MSTQHEELATVQNRLRTLERQGIIIRPMLPFGLSAEYARISVGLRPENERLIESLRRIL